MKADRHAYTDAPHGNEDRQDDGSNDMALQRGRDDQQACEVAGNSHDAKGMAHAMYKLGHEDLKDEQSGKDMDGGGAVAVGPVLESQQKCRKCRKVGKLGKCRAGRYGQENGRDHDVDSHAYFVNVHAAPAVPRPFGLLA